MHSLFGGSWPVFSGASDDYEDVGGFVKINGQSLACWPLILHEKQKQLT
jgi:hypothetical protein